MIPRRRGSAAIVLLLCSGLLLFAQSPATKRLIQLLNTPNFLDTDDAEVELLRAAIDAGPDAVSELRIVLERSSDDDQKALVLGALMLVGGSDAISILQQHEASTADAGPALALALASADSKENRDMLTRFLANDPEDDPGIVAAAAYSLGLLRAGEAVPRLRVLAQGPADRDTTDIAKLARRWIEKGFEVIAFQPNDDRQAILAAVLGVGIPHGDYEYLLDDKGGGFWQYAPAGWTFSRGKSQTTPSDAPKVDDFFLSSDGSRAFATVTIFCGPRCGVGPLHAS